MSRKILIVLGIGLLVLFVGSFLFKDKNDTKVQEKGKSTQTQAGVLLTAIEAYNQLVAEARKWQPDAMAYKLVGGSNRPNVNPDLTKDGKSSNWRFWFLSQSKKEIRVYSFRNGKPYYYPEASGGSKIAYKASDWTNDWQIDSNKAFEIAKREGIVEPLLVHMYLKDASFVFVPNEVIKASPPCKVWWEIWGKDQTGINKTIYINATSGKVLK